MRRDSAQLALGLGIVSLVLWPFSYAWVLDAERNPDWILVLLQIAEWGAIACAIAAIWLGLRARRSGSRSRGAVWAPRIGAATVALVVVPFIVASALYR